MIRVPYDEFRINIGAALAQRLEQDQRDLKIS